MNLALSSSLFVAVVLLLVVAVVFLSRRDTRTALLAVPILVVNLLGNLVALAGLPLQVAGKLLGAVDAFTVAQWAETAHWLASDSNSVEERRYAAELRARVAKAHGLGKPAAPTPLVVPARTIPEGMEGVIR